MFSNLVFVACCALAMAVDNPAPNFPPGQYLGKGLDMTAAFTLDIRSVANSVSSFGYVLKFGGDEGGNTVAGAPWQAPKGITVGTDTSEAEQELLTYKDGDAAAKELNIGGSLSGAYDVVSGDASVDLGYAKTFNNQHQYAVFGYKQGQYVAHFDEWADMINDHILLKGLQIAGVAKWNPNAEKDERKAAVSAWKSVFQLLGTHIIDKVDYGSRLTVCAWASNSDETVVKKFKADVNVALNGLVDKGAIDVHANGSAQYDKFQESFQKRITCNGGDVTLGGEIQDADTTKDVYSTYQRWKKSAQQNPDVTNFNTVPIWNIIKAASTPSVSDMGASYEAAYQYIANNPETHKTLGRWTITGDSAMLDLISTASTFSTEGLQDMPQGFTMNNEKTKITWDSVTGFVVRQPLDFYIINDGQNVDLNLFVGDGEVIVEFARHTYAFNGSTGGWAGKLVPACPVNPVPESAAGAATIVLTDPNASESGIAAVNNTIGNATGDSPGSSQGYVERLPNDGGAAQSLGLPNWSEAASS